MNTIYTSLPLYLFHFLDLVPSLSVCFPLSLSLFYCISIQSLFFSLSISLLSFRYAPSLSMLIPLYLSVFSLSFCLHIQSFLFICFLYFTKYRSLCFNLLFFIYLYLRRLIFTGSSIFIFSRQSVRGCVRRSLAGVVCVVTSRRSRRAFQRVCAFCEIFETRTLPFRER